MRRISLCGAPTSRLVLDQSPRIDMTRVKARADTVVSNAQGVEKWLRSMKGYTVINGHTRFEDPEPVNHLRSRKNERLLWL